MSKKYFKKNEWAIYWSEYGRLNLIIYSHEHVSEYYKILTSVYDQIILTSVKNQIILTKSIITVFCLVFS